MIDNDNRKTIDRFGGVADAISWVKLPDPFVPWAQGGFCDSLGEFRRLPGKRLVENSTALGSILCIRQLDFRDRTVVVAHASCMIQTFSVTELSTLTISTTSTVPFNPFVYL